MSVFLRDLDVTLLHGEVLEQLATLPDGSVDCCITSPPYWGLRDYGTGAWEGGDPDCQHDTKPARNGRGGSGAPGKQTEGAFPSEFAAESCGKCGARRQDQQLGLEPTPELYVERMVAVFREVRRVLAAHGTCWLNIGDSYASQGGPEPAQTKWQVDGASKTMNQGQSRTPGSLKPKDLVGIPWRLAFALQADGWWLRSAITWVKPNAMPESVTDRPTKATEMVFLLTKAARYYYDAEAVREPHAHDGRQVTKVVGGNGSIQHRDGERWPGTGRNLRDWWEIATQPFPQAHFATFPEELVRRCVLAGSSERGRCPECGKPWERQTEKSANGKVEKGRHGLGNEYRRETHGAAAVNREGFQRGVVYETVGWLPSCVCALSRGDAPSGPRGSSYAVEGPSPLESVPCVVLDPFVGSGTVPLVARKHGRHSIGIDLNADYLAMAADRLSQLSLLTEGAAT